jgi:diguanylate cyclase (GGDEF)-like protein
MSSLDTARGLLLGVAAASVLSVGVTAHNKLRFDQTQNEVATLENEVDGARALLLALTQIESASRGFQLYGAPTYVELFQRAAAALESPEIRRAAEAVDAADAATGTARTKSLPEQIELSLTQRRLILDLVARGEVELARRGTTGNQLLRVSTDMRTVIEGFAAQGEARLAALKDQLGRQQDIVLGLVAASGILTIASLGLAWTLLRRRSATAESARRALDARGREMEALLRLSEVLQACQNNADLEQVVSHGAAQIVPGSAGALFVFNNSRDRMDLAACWSGKEPLAAGAVPALDHLTAEDCWALKRGRPHACGKDGLTCRGLGDDRQRLCFPMAARGEVYGVLQFEDAGEPEDLRLASALADGVTLALANQSLREKLRGQALRDALTGLHNRRFLEEVGMRIASQCERRGAALSVAMLDLDHFKQVNDRLGHAAGDAALRAVAQDILSDMRRTDLACRYGGEEILLLLPDCDTDGALGRVERLRERAALARGFGVPGLAMLTFSAGVATVPASAETLEDAIRAADKALYAAKQAGRNRVVAAPLLLRPLQPQEAAMAAPAANRTALAAA